MPLEIKFEYSRIYCKITNVMTKFHSILLLAIISIFAISCENTNPIYNDFIGEYEMTTEVIPVYGDTEIDFLPVVKSNVTIYEEKNKLFIQTDNFGMPFVQGDNPIPMEDENQQPESDNTNSNLENVVVNTSAIYIKNGLIYSVFQGVSVKSLPIQVKSVENTKLRMDNSKPFEVKLVDMTGDHVTNIAQHFEYDPIFKQNETLTWELALRFHQPIKEGDAELTYIRYKNVLTKIN